MEATPEYRAGKYVIFQLSRQYFAIRSERIRQILPAAGLQRLTTTLTFLVGVVSANGRTVPVLDIRERCGVPPRQMRPTSCILIVSLDEGLPFSTIGVLADKLSEVLEFRPVEIRGSTAQLRVQGRPYGRPKTLLEPEQLLSADQWGALAALGTVDTLLPDSGGN